MDGRTMKDDKPTKYKKTPIRQIGKIFAAFPPKKVKMGFK
jgi:hypothetical protein